MKVRHLLDKLSMSFASDGFPAGFSLPQQGDLAAKRALEQAIALQPNDTEAQTNLGSILHRMGRLHEAGRMLSRAIELDPTCADAHLNLGLVRHEQGEWRQALESFNRALSLGTDQADLWAALGNCLTALGSREDALNAYERAARLRPRAPEVQFLRGDLFPIIAGPRESVAA